MIKVYLIHFPTHLHVHEHLLYVKKVVLVQFLLYRSLRVRYNTKLAGLEGKLFFLILQYSWSQYLNVQKTCLFMKYINRENRVMKQKSQGWDWK